MGDWKKDKRGDRGDRRDHRDRHDRRDRRGGSKRGDRRHKVDRDEPAVVRRRSRSVLAVEVTQVHDGKRMVSEFHPAKVPSPSPTPTESQPLDGGDGGPPSGRNDRGRTRIVREGPRPVPSPVKPAKKPRAKPRRQPVAASPVIEVPVVVEDVSPPKQARSASTKPMPAQPLADTSAPLVPSRGWWVQVEGEGVLVRANSPDAALAKATSHFTSAQLANAVIKYGDILE